MRKIVLGLAISLDGFIEGPNGEYDWCFTDQDYGLSDFFKRVDTVFIGRKTYEVTVSMGDRSGGGFPYLKKYIFSTTIGKAKDGGKNNNRRHKDKGFKNQERKGEGYLAIWWCRFDNFTYQLRVG